MRQYLLHYVKFRFCQVDSKLIQPEPFTSEKIDNLYLIKSNTYEFVIKRLPQKHEIYKHTIQTPAAVLKKPGIHILPRQIPELNKRQKFQAVQKKVNQDKQKSFRGCKTPNQIFHLHRKVNHDIRKRLQFIGIVQNKYKHYMMYESFAQTLKRKTRQQYLKKGVKVNSLGFTIYPKGDVWMPTNEKYMSDLIEVLKRLEGDKNVHNILDIGCGSGVLSFLCRKSFKKAKIIGFDINQSAVDTANVTAAQNNIDNFHSFQFDVNQQIQFAEKAKQLKIPETYDLITINPPWIHAKKLSEQSELQGGVYDYNGKMLESSLKLASKLLKDNNSKIFLIYSDLNKILGLQKKSIQTLCRQNSLLICECKERPLTANIESPSPLNQYKQKSKIQFFEIRKS